MRVILVPIADRPECAVALDATLRLAGKMGASLIGCHIRPHRTSALRMRASAGELDHSTLDWEAGLRGRNPDRMSAAAEKLFARVVAEHGFASGRRPRADGKAVAIWQKRVGSPARVMPIIGPASDLVVVSRPAADGRIARVFLMEALLHSTRPVLVLPQTPVRSVGRRVAIGWNQSAEASRALAAALPVLVRADEVTIINCGPESRPGPKSRDMVRYLAHHGIAAKRVSGVGRHPEQEIVQACRASRADLLVMGAYSRHRYRELLFGGVTEHMLKKATLPVLMYHA